MTIELTDEYDMDISDNLDKKAEELDESLHLEHGNSDRKSCNPRRIIEMLNEEKQLANQLLFGDF